MRTFFGDLPLELRVPIYRELLTTDKPVDAIKHRSRRDTHMKPRRKNNIHPAILRTCKQAYFEASKYLYEENRIRFDVIDYYEADKTLLWGDSYGLSKSNLAQIKHVGRLLSSASLTVGPSTIDICSLKSPTATLEKLQLRAGSNIQNTMRISFH